jgi:hypothetical protein
LGFLRKAGKKPEICNMQKNVSRETFSEETKGRKKRGKSSAVYFAEMLRRFCRNIDGSDALMLSFVLASC